MALAHLGYEVTGSDLSPAEITRAKLEAEQRDLTINYSVCDLRDAYVHHGNGYDIVICADNSLPHLLPNDDVQTALQQMHACIRPGGGCIVTVRDYDNEERGANLVKLYDVRTEGSKRYLLFQIWDFENQYCDITFFFIEEDTTSREVKTYSMRSKCYAVSTNLLMGLMAEVGFQRVRQHGSWKN